MGDAGEGGADADVEMETDEALSGMAVEQHGESAPTAELPAASSLRRAKGTPQRYGPPSLPRGSRAT